jgi:hypothetical protein
LHEIIWKRIYVEIGLLTGRTLQRVHNNSLKPWIEREEEEKKDFVFSNQENQVNPSDRTIELCVLLLSMLIFCLKPVFKNFALLKRFSSLKLASGYRMVFKSKPVFILFNND